MTPDERARLCVLDCLTDSGNWIHPDQVRVKIAAAIRAAVDATVGEAVPAIVVVNQTRHPLDCDLRYDAHGDGKPFVRVVVRERPSE